MNTTAPTHVSPVGSQASFTEGPAPDSNQRVGDWIPSLFLSKPVTPAGQALDVEEESWAQLAAAARAEWAAENPY